jgi:hypothetical protein
VLASIVQSLRLGEARGVVWRRAVLIDTVRYSAGCAMLATVIWDTRWRPGIPICVAGPINGWRARVRGSVVVLWLALEAAVPGGSVFVRGRQRAYVPAS